MRVDKRQRRAVVQHHKEGVNEYDDESVFDDECITTAFQTTKQSPTLEHSPFIRIIMNTRYS